jgi:nitrogen-specific signal transduction histidine kinase
MRAPLLLEHVSSNIFEPFISKTKKGMGIGLAVSRLIVEAMWAAVGRKTILISTHDSHPKRLLKDA